MQTFTLNSRFSLTAFTAWYAQEDAGATARIVIPAMQWSLAVTKTDQPGSVILHPAGHRARHEHLDNVVRILRDIQRGLAARASQASG